MNYRKTLKKLKKELNVIYVVKEKELSALQKRIDANDEYLDEELDLENELTEDTEDLTALISNLDDVLDSLEHYGL